LLRNKKRLWLRSNIHLWLSHSGVNSSLVVKLIGEGLVVVDNRSNSLKNRRLINRSGNSSLLFLLGDLYLILLFKKL